MELWRKYGSTDFETSSPILKAFINNQEERLTTAIIKFGMSTLTTKNQIVAGFA